MFGGNFMTTSIRVVFWIFGTSASLILLLLSGLMGKITGDIGEEIVVWVGLLGMVASAYSAIFLVYMGGRKLLALNKFQRVREILGAANAMLGGMVALTGGFALIAVGLYLGYLFVSWAGFVGTLLTVIAGFLFLIFLLMLDR